MQILSFACGCGVVAPIPAIPPAAGLLSPPAVLPAVDEIVTGGGGLAAGVDVDELCCRSAAAVVTVDVGPAADWVRLAMIMSLRVRVPPSAGDSEVVMLAGSEVALWMSGSFLALNKRILARLGLSSALVTSSLTRFNPIN